MKTLFTYNLVLCILYSTENQILAGKNFLAVSSLDSIENWAFVQQCLNSTHGTPEEEETFVKNKICLTIVESEFYRETFNVFPIKPHWARIISALYFKQVPKNITGPYSRREIIVNENIFHNFVFPCLSWHHDEKFVEFFISRPFRRHDLLENNHTPFRLLFKQDEKNELIGNAIVEERVS